MLFSQWQSPGHPSPACLHHQGRFFSGGCPSPNIYIYWHRQGGEAKLREADAPLSREPNLGLDPRTQKSGPEPPSPIAGFLIDFIFQRFQVHSKMEWPHCTHSCIASPTINILHQTGKILTKGEPTLTHHYHPKFIVYIRMHSWCCTLYGF